MIEPLGLKVNNTEYKIIAWLPALLISCVALQLSFDLVESKFHQSSFYISESFIFSSFWWLFLPFLAMLRFFTNAHQAITKQILLSICIAATHLFVYPAVVWIISISFYTYTFPYWQTFNYGLVEYSFVLLIIYSGYHFFYTRFTKKLSSDNKPSPAPPVIKDLLPSSFLVTSGTLQIIVEVKDISVLSANPPYVNIYVNNKSYLLNETLKSVAIKLNQEVFIRVHKSTIVNITKVQSMKSRLNGDYDLALTDGKEVRLSRNFASEFKQKFEYVHRSP